MSLDKNEAYFELSYTYEETGSVFDHDNQEQPIEFEINVTISFMWNDAKNRYEVEYYASSPTVDYVEMPRGDKLKKDVLKDLKAKGINLDYIPDFNEWGL